ncbi:methionine ABC transporter ATP-binding protein [Planococcus sp. N028]|uniref:Methionine ABC transporter ATP-binding protein n=1 Tax=Planococcus shixiaomingii TaxID=3058393 RepID=A0ABT8N1Z8_9BACL|nr:MULTISPECIES: methionine ABC transporter ATP-binding protein [unclassified Planococcus (in: firmicutes)]MDN7241920.1 methionine ABC transporter ATP-binding protein [Planococcus sp. N028]WKA54205.1 methionine ABC transporter ATP-binding protein [Planococcus sp. N022]
MIQFEGVTKTYQSGKQEIHALNGIDLTVETGEIFGVIGFSGAGKSSLIRTVNLLERPTKGLVKIHGKDISTLSSKEIRKTRKDIGMIFQHFNLLNSKTVFHNVAMPLILANTPKDKIKDQVKNLLDFVGLADQAQKYPDQLSGGQKQRIGIARALATNPSVLLCDEATSALDPQTTQSILDLLRKINREYNITILLITHEMGVIREICDKVAVLEAGKVIEQGSVFDIFTNPQQPTTQRFVRSVMNDELPESLLQQIQNAGSNHSIYRIQFHGKSVGRPLISQVSREFNLDLNVLFGNITELQGRPYGNLIVEFIGDRAEIIRALTAIQNSDATVEEVQNYAS